MNTRDSLLVAQLSQVTISFLGVLNKARRENSHVREVINPLFVEAGYNERNSLINQGTLIGYAYLTLVWLWEKQPAEFAKNVPDYPLDKPVALWPNLSDTVLKWEHGLNRQSHQSFHSWLRHIRNALSHGRVSFDPSDDYTLVFADALPGANELHTEILLSPQRLSSVADLVLSACEKSVA